MAITSNLGITVDIAGDVTFLQRFDCAAHVGSPGEISLVALSTSPVTLSNASNSALGILILPPAGNTVAITLKGVTGDTGFALSKTNPTFLSIPATTPFVLVAASPVVIRVIWV